MPDESGERLRSPHADAPPAPWTLSGTAWVVLFKAPRDWICSHAPEFVDASTAGGVGSLMLVDYETSPVGPYRELLIIPGRYEPANGPADGPTGRRAVITDIYVSSQESVVGGRRNWGLPKRLAEFELSEANGRQRIAVTLDGSRLFDATVSAGGVPFPVSTALLPFPLAQERDGRLYYTDFRGAGWGKLGRFEALNTDGSRFPDISKVTPRLVVRVNPFHITFPTAHVVSASRRPKNP